MVGVIPPWRASRGQQRSWRREGKGTPANHWKQWDAKPEAGARDFRATLVRLQIRQTIGNGGTAKPEAKAQFALCSFGYRILCV